MKNKHVEKKFYLPTHGSLEELSECLQRVLDFINKHEWPYPPSYSIVKDGIEVFGVRRKREDTAEIPALNMEDRVVGAKKPNNFPSANIKTLWEQTIKDKDA